jgi:hypothetical protein
MLYGLSRPTADVDVLEIAPRAAADAFSQVAMLGRAKRASRFSLP